MSLVGYSPDKSRSIRLKARLTPWDLSAAGGLSGAGTRLIFQPLDVAKIRLQLQLETRDQTSRKYRGMFHLIYTMFSFLAFETCTKMMFQSGFSLAQDPTWKPLTHFICGSAGGCVGTVTSFPFDVLRTRIVAQPESKKVYLSMRDAAVKLHKEAGVRGFFKGFVPTVVAIAPQTGLQFGFYTFFNQILENFIVQQDENSGQKTITMLGSLSCGGMAGLCAKLVVYPLDTTKKRLQTSGWNEGRTGMGSTGTYRSTSHCIGEIFRREGLAGFYKGVGPALIKSVLTTSMHFWLYETVCYLLALRHIGEDDLTGSENSAR